MVASPQDLRRRMPLASMVSLAFMAVLAARATFTGASFVMNGFAAPRIAAVKVRSARAHTKAGLRAESGDATAAMSYGHCLQEDGSWKMTTEGVPIPGPEEEALAEKGWQAFSKQFEAAAKRGMYLDTPVAEQDIKYRWRRLRDSFGVSSEEALQIVEDDATPLVIDSNYVQETFDAMVEGASQEKALEIIKKHPGVLASGKAIKDNMAQADAFSNVISFGRQVGSMFR